MNTLESRHEKIRNATVLLLFLVISAVFLGMIWDFLLAVLMAAIFSGLSNPVY